MLLFDVQRDFDKACKVMLQKNPHLNIPWNFVKDHERYPLVIQKVCNQVLMFERGLTQGQRTAYNRSQLIQAHAQLFVKFAIQNRDHTVMSEADRTLLEVGNKAQKEVREMGVIKELDTKTGELKDL